jgi:hypothetical protein
MNEIIFKGIDGSNPLHMLAGLGVLRLLHLHDADVKMCWFKSDTWHPAYHTASSLESIVLHLAGDLNRLGKTGGGQNQEKNRKVRDLGATLKKTREQLKDERNKALNEAKRQNLKKEEKNSFLGQALADLNSRIVGLEKDLAEAQSNLNDALGEGIAHLGDIIAVSPDIFRRRAISAVDAWLSPDGNKLLAEALSSQAVDAIADGGKVVPTPFSFSNGSSGQCLLKDFRNCAEKCDTNSIIAIVDGVSRPSSDVTGLNWDPASQRSYALQWDDPSTGGSADPGVNALAFVGLCFMTVVPFGVKLAATGWKDTRDKRGFSWPVWTKPIGLDTVRALLSSGSSLASLAGAGECFFSQCINPTGKRNFFAPSTPL